jgi:hypothetical protein
MIERNTFLQELQEWNSKHKTHAILPHYIPNFKVAPLSLQNDTGTIGADLMMLWRQTIIDIVSMKGRLRNTLNDLGILYGSPGGSWT